MCFVAEQENLVISVIALPVLKLLWSSQSPLFGMLWSNSTTGNRYYSYFLSRRPECPELGIITQEIGDALFAFLLNLWCDLSLLCSNLFPGVSYLFVSCFSIAYDLVR